MTREPLELDSFLAQAEPELRGPHPEPWFDRIDANYEDFARALDELDPHEALRLASLLWRYWLERGRLDEGRGRLAELLDRADNRNDSSARAQALTGAGILAFRAGDDEAARMLHSEALEVSRRVSDRDAEARALGGLARVALRAGDMAATRRYAEESVAIWRELGDRVGLARTLHLLPYIEYTEGSDDRARELFEESLALAREIGDVDLACGELTNLASVETRAGNLGRALELGRESLRAGVELESDYLIPYCVVNLGGVAVAHGDVDSGLRIVAAGKAMFDRAGMAIDPGTAIEFERHLDRAKASLRTSFQRVWDEGYVLPRQDAVELALGYEPARP